MPRSPHSIPLTHQRIDPYKNFKFVVRFGDAEVAGLSKMSALKTSTEAVEWREAGDPARLHKLPATTTFEPIMLERGLSHDREFVSWVREVVRPGGLSAAQLRSGFRRRLIIEVRNCNNQGVIQLELWRAWPSQFQATPDLDANAHAIAIQSLKIEHEGFEIKNLYPDQDEQSSN